MAFTPDMRAIVFLMMYAHDAQVMFSTCSLTRCSLAFAIGMLATSSAAKAINEGMPFI